MGMDISGRNPSSEEGKYFRASVWSWGPIHALCETVMKYKYPDWAYNDGCGFEGQVPCTTLADALERYLDQHPQECIEIESSCRVSEDGQFLPQGSTGGQSAYSTSQEHVREFITFLRACGGFEVW